MSATCWINVYAALPGDGQARFYANGRRSRAEADASASRMWPRLYVIRCTPKGRAR